MFYTYVVRFDGTENLKFLTTFFGTKQGHRPKHMTLVHNKCELRSTRASPVNPGR